MLNISLKEAWAFFSSPINLKHITPPKMGFQIISGYEEDAMHAGMIIKYIVKPILGLPITWVTEISHVQEPNFFVDEQRAGPYSFWHHQHHFRSTEEGTLMVDIINYSVPYGFIGRLLHWLFIKKELQLIFNYRHKILDQKFNR
ncbi:SRPBCC family protein [Fulvivirgaceae bacterium BMA10]|uniref:SRPBCC family protein n=1 Tax=Splendidivirga corallicola TaxID=3051826 RepID=A0ABT8KW67_9BACT|nr:SRPBCC family protein [Fulvivirgaceae bacterium BMA10]